MGFPIAMCILMYTQNKTILTEIKDSLNNNTLALNEVANLVKELRGDK